MKTIKISKEAYDLLIHITNNMDCVWETLAYECNWNEDKEEGDKFPPYTNALNELRNL